MTRNGKGSNFRWVLAVAAGIGIGYWLFSPTEENISQASDKRHISVDIQAADETSATFIVRKLAGAPGKLTVVIPAGTVIRNSDSSGQGLVTARAVTLRLSANVPEATQQVETYCLHQFLTPPTLKSSLALASLDYIPDQGGVSWEQMEPLHRLADCLAQQTDSRTDRQLAVWMIADDRVEHSYEQVRWELRNQFRSQAKTRLRTGIDSEIREKLRRQFPSLSEDRLRDEIDYYMEHNLEKRVNEEAENQLKEFLQRARPLLERCGNKPSEMRFFQTAGG